MQGQLPTTGQDIIELPKPITQGGMPVLDAISKRRSTRDFKTDPITLQQLSNVLWVAAGLNRPQSGVGIFVEGSGSAPGAHNWQEIDVYVLTAQGVHVYDPAPHHLRKVHDRDIRIFTGNLIQPFVLDAPVSLLYVTDFNRMPHCDDWDRSVFPWANAGVRVENVYLYCASEGLGTVCRAMFDRPALTKELDIAKHQMVSLHQVIGYAK
jgi:nitroreductase